MAGKRLPPPDVNEYLLSLMGLGVRGGLAMPGVDGTVALLRRGKCHAVIMARDASRRATQKVKPLAEEHGVPVVTGPAAEQIGDRLGRPPVMVVGVKDRDLAAGMLSAAMPAGT